MFSLIAAIGKNNELGKNGKLIFSIKDDMKFFRNTTMGHKILMGHKTWDSLPHKLSGRTNIVISRNPVPDTDLTINDLPKFISENKKTDEEIFVIGGGMVYFELLKHAQNIYLTEVDATDLDADTFFPAFDKSNYDQTIIKRGTENGLDYTISKYTLKR